MGNYGINDEKALAHFLAQAGEETGEFQKESVTEGLYYKEAHRVERIFSSKFGKDSGKKASDYLRNSEKLANYVYSDRMGNGNEASGEGYKFRGRGIFQLTGKSLYEEFGTYYQKEIDSTKDFTKNPELIADDFKIALTSALWYFKEKVLPNVNINKATVKEVTRPINAGYVGLSDRENYYKAAIKTLTK